MFLENVVNLQSKVTEILVNLQKIVKDFNYQELFGSVIESELNRYKENKFMFSIIGNAKRGKSTLINAILGRCDDNIAPIQSVPCTSAITQYNSINSFNKKNISDDREFAMIYKHGETDEKGFKVDIKDIPNYVTEELNPGNKKRVRKVNVYGKFPLLNENICFVDTPGGGSVHENHTELLYNYFPLTDAIIFLVSANIPIDASEIELLKAIKKEDTKKIFFVLTKVDTIDESEMEDVEKFVNDEISKVGLNCDKLYKVCAKQVFENNKNGIFNETIYKNSGLRELENDIENLILNVDQTQNLSNKVKNSISKVNDIIKYINEELNFKSDLFNKPIVEILKEIEDLKVQEINIKKTTEKSILKFENSYNKIIYELEKKYFIELNNLREIIYKKVENYGNLRVLINSSKLIYDIEKDVKKLMEMSFGDAKEKLNTALADLNMEYLDNISLPVLKNNSIFSKNFPSIIAGGAEAIGAAAGSGLAITGGGLIAANIATLSGAYSAVAAQGAVYANQGILLSTWQWFFGNAAVETAAVGWSKAFIVAIPSFFSGIALIGGGVIIYKLINNFGALLGKDKLVDFVINEGKNIFEQLQKAFKEYKMTLIQTYNNLIEKDLNLLKEKLEDAKLEKAKNSPEKKNDLDNQKKIIQIFEKQFQLLKDMVR